MANIEIFPEEKETSYLIREPSEAFCKVTGIADSIAGKKLLINCKLAKDWDDENPVPIDEVNELKMGFGDGMKVSDYMIIPIPENTICKNVRAISGGERKLECFVPEPHNHAFQFFYVEEDEEDYEYVPLYDADDYEEDEVIIDSYLFTTNGRYASIVEQGNHCEAKIMPGTVKEDFPDSIESFDEIDYEAKKPGVEEMIGSCDGGKFYEDVMKKMDAPTTKTFWHGDGDSPPTGNDGGCLVNFMLKRNTLPWDFYYIYEHDEEDCGNVDKSSLNSYFDAS